MITTAPLRACPLAAGLLLPQSAAHAAATAAVVQQPAEYEPSAAGLKADLEAFDAKALDRSN